MRAHPDRVNLGLALVADVRLDQAEGEHVAVGQELVVGLERVERALERRRHGPDLRQGLLGQLVDVGVERLAGIQAAFDPVEARQHQRAERQVRIRGRVG